MTDKRFSPLPVTLLEAGASFHRAQSQYPSNVTLDSPAQDVMTDLKKVRAITVEPTFSISAANMKMIHAGVRLLLVTNGVGTIIGLITATDILGEKPMQYMINAGGLYEDIQVQHIMTPREALEVLQMTDVAKAQVGNIVETLKRCGRQHALVVDADKKTNKTCVRGIFSSTQIGRQMGVKLDVYEVVHSFAELGQVLSR